MADWSALTGGYMQGRESTLKARRQQQMEKYNDLVLKESGRESLKRDIAGERSARKIEGEYGGKMPRFSFMGTKDPWGKRLVKSIAGAMGFKGQEQALPFGSTPDFSNMPLGPEEAPGAVMGESSVVSPMALPANELEGDPEQPLYEADGGYLKMADGKTPADILEQFLPETRRGGFQIGAGETPPPGESNIPIEETSVGDQPLTEAQRDAMEKANKAETNRARWERGKANVGEGAAKVRRGINFTNPPEGTALGNTARAAARWGIPIVAAGYGIKRQMEPDAAERGEKRFGWEGPTPDEGDASFGGYMRFLGKQGLLFASDVGDFLSGGLASSLLYRDEEGNTGKRQALPDNKPLNRDPSVRTPANTAGTPQSPQGPSTPSSGEPSEPPNPMLNFGKVRIAAKDIPNYTTQDWANFRMEAKMQAALSGLDPASMEEQVQDQITRMQMKGFSSYGHQGLLLQQAGDREGAMAAYRAAFQYLPNGVNIEFGTGTNNKDGREYILGFAVDEKTHQPIPGSAMVMTPDHVATMLDSMKDDKAWSEHVKDVRDYRLKERDTESMIQYRADTGDAALERAYKAGQGGGAAGMKPSDIRGTSALLNNNPYIQQLQLQDMNLALTVKSLAARIIRMTGADPDTVVLSLKNAYATNSVQQYLQSVGITMQDVAAAQQEAASGAAASGPPQQSGPVTPRAGPPTITNPHTAPSNNPAIPENAEDADEGLLQPRPVGRRRTPEEWLHAQPGRENDTYAVDNDAGPFEDNDNAPAMTMQQFMRTHNGLTPDQYRAAMSRPAP
jgi:hypothetical protein